MEVITNTMETLFQQLGLPHTKADIEKFIAQHRPIPPQVSLSSADFWTPAQASFLKECIKEDADWAPIVDALNAQLRG